MGVGILVAGVELKLFVLVVEMHTYAGYTWVDESHQSTMTYKTKILCDVSHDKNISSLDKSTLALDI